MRGRAWIAATLATLVAAAPLAACGKPASERAIPASSPSGSDTSNFPSHPVHPPPPPAPPGVPVHVTLEEWDVVPAYSSAPSGKVTFEVQNQGFHPHEFYVVRTDDPAADLPTTRDIADLKRAGRVAGSLGAFPPGETKRLDVDLPAGHYVLLCNLVMHYERGMHANFEAR